jgi:hypothetical protein
LLEPPTARQSWPEAHETDTSASVGVLDGIAVGASHALRFQTWLNMDKSLDWIWSEPTPMQNDRPRQERLLRERLTGAVLDPAVAVPAPGAAGLANPAEAGPDTALAARPPMSTAAATVAFTRRTCTAELPSARQPADPGQPLDAARSRLVYLYPDSRPVLAGFRPRPRPGYIPD